MPFLAPAFLFMGLAMHGVLAFVQMTKVSSKKSPKLFVYQVEEENNWTHEKTRKKKKKTKQKR